MIEKTEETIKNGLQKKIATLDAQDTRRRQTKQKECIQKAQKNKL
jgi:hypothetical protein